MTVRYTKFKTYVRPIGRLCMHCGRDAYITAIKRNGRFRTPVHYCDEHAEVAHEINERSRA